MKAYGNPRYLDANMVVQQMVNTKALVETMDLRMGVAYGTRRVVVVIRVDGAELHGSKGAVLFGFMRIPVLLAQCSESRSFFNAPVPAVVRGLVDLQRDGIKMLCKDANKTCECTSVAPHDVKFVFKFVSDLKEWTLLRN